jgi:hypothetical protein
MADPRDYIGRRLAPLLLVGAVLACGSDNSSSFPRPSEPIEASLYDIVAGPIDRASALNVVSGRGAGIPVAVRVDVTDQWDIAYGVLDGETVWLPAGFFEGFSADAGIYEVPEGFEQLAEAPDNKELYEKEQPVPLTEGVVYIIRSRTDPALSVPCHLYAKVFVEAVKEDPPSRVDLLILWNPNCDDRNLTPGDAQ